MATKPIPKKLHIPAKVLPTRTGEVGPAKSHKPAMVAGGDRFVHGERPHAPELPPRVRAGGFASSAAALLGKKVITTAAAALDVLVKMHAESPNKAAAELQRMAKTGLSPYKGSENV